MPLSDHALNAAMTGRSHSRNRITRSYSLGLNTPPPPPPPPVGAPINITTSGTYSGIYQSTDATVPAVTISTTAPVILSRAHIIHKGIGVRALGSRSKITILDSVFDQLDPGPAPVANRHRAVNTSDTDIFVFEHNILTNGDGVLIGSGGPANPATQVHVNYNMSTNIGHYPHPSADGPAVQFIALENVSCPDVQIQWNHSFNQPGQSGVDDNILLIYSGGTDSSHRVDISHNLVDGAYPVTPDANYVGGGINQGDDSASPTRLSVWSSAHDNVVVSTTNYAIAVNSANNYADNNLLVNDAIEQSTNNGVAISAYMNVTPAGSHATGNRINWVQSAGSSSQAVCYTSDHAAGTIIVSTTEQQARDEWEASRVAAGVIVGPRP